MSVDDVIYLFLLCFCMGFGVVYRKIGDAETKKIVGGALGFTLVVLVSGLHTIHLLINTTINAFLILHGDRK